MDVLYTFRLYLLWKYPSGIYYPLAYCEWQANFFAKATGNNQNTGPVNTIYYPGVEVTVDYQRSNDPPPPNLMAPPIFNGNNQWVDLA